MTAKHSLEAEFESYRHQMEPQQASIKEQGLWCCLDRLEVAERNVAAMRRALSEYRFWSSSCLERLEAAGRCIASIERGLKLH